MISIDQQPWAHRGGPAFVTSELSPIADPRRSLMNWPCSPSLFNWWRVLFQVDHHYVPRIHRFSKTPPPFPKLLFPAFFKHLAAKDKPTPTLTRPPQYSKRSVLQPASEQPVRLLETDIQCFFVIIEAYQVYQLKSVLRCEQKSRGFSLCSHSSKKRWSSWQKVVLKYPHVCTHKGTHGTDVKYNPGFLISH